MLENIVYVGVSFAAVFLSLEAAWHFTACSIHDKSIKQCFYKQVGLLRQKGVPRKIMATVERSERISMWINPNADNTHQSKICPNCSQENDRYGLPIYPFNKSTKALNWCTKCLGTVEDITTTDRELPNADNVQFESITKGSDLTFVVYRKGEGCESSKGYGSIMASIIRYFMRLTLDIRKR